MTLSKQQSVLISGLLLFFGNICHSYAVGADTHNVLPYCNVSDQHTPPPSTRRTFYMARSDNGNFLPQWCNLYNLNTSSTWANNNKEVVITGSGHSIIRFNITVQPGSPPQQDTDNRKSFVFANFARCQVIVKGTSWHLGTCTTMAANEGCGYINHFFPEYKLVCQG